MKAIDSAKEDQIVKALVRISLRRNWTNCTKIYSSLWNSLELNFTLNLTDNCHSRKQERKRSRISNNRWNHVENRMILSSLRVYARRQNLLRKPVRHLYGSEWRSTRRNWKAGSPMRLTCKAYWEENPVLGKQMQSSSQDWLLESTLKHHRSHRKCKKALVTKNDFEPL